MYERIDERKENRRVMEKERMEVRKRGEGEERRAGRREVHALKHEQLAGKKKGEWTCGLSHTAHHFLR